MVKRSNISIPLLLAVFTTSISACDGPSAPSSQKVVRCLVADQQRARIVVATEDNCLSDETTLRYALRPEVEGELDGKPINSDEGMNLVTCLVSDSHHIFTRSPMTMTECGIEAADPWNFYAMVVPDYVDVYFVPDDAILRYDRTMVECRTSGGDITTSRMSCESEGGTELGVKQTINEPRALVRCSVNLDEILTTAERCANEGGVVHDEIDP